MTSDWQIADGLESTYRRKSGPRNDFDNSHDLNRFLNTLSTNKRDNGKSDIDQEGEWVKNFKSTPDPLTRNTLAEEGIMRKRVKRAWSSGFWKTISWLRTKQIDKKLLSGDTKKKVKLL